MKCPLACTTLHPRIKGTISNSIDFGVCFSCSIGHCLYWVSLDILLPVPFKLFLHETPAVGLPKPSPHQQETTNQHHISWPKPEVVECMWSISPAFSTDSCILYCMTLTHRQHNHNGRSCRRSRVEYNGRRMCNLYASFHLAHARYSGNSPSYPNPDLVIAAEHFTAI